MHITVVTRFSVFTPMSTSGSWFTFNHARIFSDLSIRLRLPTVSILQTENNLSTNACDTHTRLTALCPGLPGWAGTRKVKTNLDFTEARDSEWQWHQLDHMQVCTSLQTDNHTSTPPLSFLKAGCPSCRPTNSVKALKANHQPVSGLLAYAVNVQSG